MGDINTAVNTPTVLAGVGSGNVVLGPVSADAIQNVGCVDAGHDYFPGYGIGDINTAVNAPTVLAGVGEGNFVLGPVSADAYQNVGSLDFGF
jgi:hypothetical protein